MTQVKPEKAAVSSKQVAVQSVRPCLTFRDRAEEAINFYVSVFPNSRVSSMQRAGANGPIPEGKLLHASFQLDGQEYTALDGGPPFAFNEAFSLVVTCETQDQIDEMWARLTEGGEAGPCGWLKDRFGVSWQVVPAALGKMMADPKSGNAAKVMQAVLKMGKLDIATLEQAYRSGA
jgi:predicted 3-demethylubiquinone-9 3-methyltransferase (glyoxalase superfamily)